MAGPSPVAFHTPLKMQPRPGQPDYFPKKKEIKIFSDEHFNLALLVQNSNSTKPLYAAKKIDPSKEENKKQIEKIRQNFQTFNDEVFHKTKLCIRYETKGTCRFGDGCGFAHGQAELKPNPRE